MALKVKFLDSDRFDYAKFHSDFNKRCKERGTNAKEVSITRLFKAESYISTCMSRKRLPLNIFFALCEWFDLNAKDYEIKKAEPPKPTAPPAKDDKAAQNDAQGEAGWLCELKIDEGFGTVMLKVTHDGETVGVGRSFLYGTNNAGILQSISYAAHMAYKFAQQGVLEDIGGGNKRVTFKNWVARYKDLNSDEGRLARYVESHYKEFPAVGKKNMLIYLAQNSGAAHVGVFKIVFDQYLKWYVSNAE